MNRSSPPGSPRRLTGTEADADKDGRVSIVEAFTWARDQVAKVYESTNRLQTEHAMLADSGGVAARIAFGGDAASTDPRVMALVGERRVLESLIDSLRRLKPTMDSTAYQQSLEKLLLQIAAKTQAIKALQAGPHVHERLFGSVGGWRSWCHGRSPPSKARESRSNRCT